ncbi:MAG: hypothetical protein J0L56_09180 [Chitinophagales bacterium]|nr:hypothetical protein [Chitinophagales bacterium]
MNNASISRENFDALASAFPSNWKVTSAGTGLTSNWSTPTNGTSTTQSANSGTPVAGGVYNWGTTAGLDRALGFMSSPSYASPNAILAWYRNNTGTTVNSVTISFKIERYKVNTDAFSLQFFSSLDGSNWSTQSTGDIDGSVFSTGPVSYSFTSPMIVTRLVTVNIAGGLADNGDIYFRWVFNTGTNSQGIGLDEVAVYAGTATPVMQATLKDILQVDNGIPNQFNEGDVIRYKAVVKNNGSGDAGNVQINLPTPPVNTTMVPGTIKTSAVAVDDSYTVSYSTILNVNTIGTGVLNNDIGIPLPTAVLTYGKTSDPTTNAGTPGVTDAGGVITLNANGTFNYSSPAGFSGADKFSYITGNGNLPNNDATVTIQVGPDISFTTTNVDPACNNGTNGSITFNASGGNGTLLYSITGAAGTYQASNSFTGLSAGVYNLAVKDAGGYIKTGTTTLNNPALIVVSGIIPALTYNTAMVAAIFTRTGGTGGVNWSATGLPAGLNINASSGAVTGTPSVTGSFNATITATDVNGCTGLKNVTILVAPKLSNDSYNAVVGNTQLVANSHSTPLTPYTTDVTNIIGNDAADVTIIITAVTGAATTAGGIITIDATGKFIYSPPVGLTGTDSYIYTGTANGVAATATISFTISNMVWYVNNTYAGGNGPANGTSARPYTDMTSAATASAVNQVIYVHTGSGNTTGNTLLKSGQTLRGGGNALSLGALSIAAGTKPTLSGTVTLANNIIADGFDMNTGTSTAITSSGATTVTVNTGNIITSGAANAISLTNTTGTLTIAGGTQTNSTGATFNISGGTADMTYSGTVSQAANAPILSVAAGHSGTLTFQTGTLSATNGTGLQFDNADGIYNFNGSTTLNGGDAGVDILNGSTGSFNFSTNTSVTNPTGTAFNLGGATASNATVTYSGAISDNTGYAIDIDNHDAGIITFQTGSLTSTGTGLRVRNCNGGTINFNNPVKSISTGASTAIDLTTSNAGVSINFGNGGLAITTTSGTGFNATGGGTISVTTGTNNNTISSTTGNALNISNTTIAAGGVTFRSISSNGAATGIILNNTGAGGFTVSGDGGGASNASGGTISNSTGIGISLTSASNVSLGYMNVQGSADAGIKGISITNFTLNRSNVTSNGNSTADEGIQFGEFSGSTLGVTGTLTISNSNVSSNAHNNIHFRNTSGVLSAFTVTNSSFNNATGPNAANSFLLEMSGTAELTTGTISGCTFSNSSPQRGLEVQVHENATIGKTAVAGVLIVQNNTFTNNGIHASFTQDVAGNMSFRFLNNGTAGSPMTGSILQALNVFSSSTSTGGTLTGRIQGNYIGNPAVAGSGSTQGSGIRILIQGRTAGTFTIDANTIRQVGSTSGSRGMDIQFLGPIATGQPITQSDITITNNFVQTDAPGATFPLAAIFLSADNQGSPARVRADIRSNTVPSTGSFDYPSFDGNGGQLVYIIATGGAVAQLVDNAPASANAMAELQSHNTGLMYADATVALISGPINTAFLRFLKFQPFFSRPMYATDTDKSFRELPGDLVIRGHFSDNRGQFFLKNRKYLFGCTPELEERKGNFS